jgi:hypothetical protein
MRGCPRERDRLPSVQSLRGNRTTADDHQRPPTSRWPRTSPGGRIGFETGREENKPLPVALHDDMFDATSRICDDEMNVIWPRPFLTEDPYATRQRRRITSVWAA